MTDFALSKRLDRNDLKSFLPDLRAVKAFEGLANDVAIAIPGAINDQAAEVAAMGDNTSTALTAVRALATRALAAVAELEDQVAVRRSDRATIRALEARVAALEDNLMTRRR